MGEIIPLFRQRASRKLTDRQKFTRALRAKTPREDWEIELDAVIGPPDDDFTPGNAA